MAISTSLSHTFFSKEKTISSLVNTLALLGLAISLIATIVLITIGAALTPCGVIFSSTIIFQSMIICLALTGVSALIFIGSCIKIFQENKYLLNQIAQ